MRRIAMSLVRSARPRGWRPRDFTGGLRRVFPDRTAHRDRRGGGRSLNVAPASCSHQRRSAHHRADDVPTKPFRPAGRRPGPRASRGSPRGRPGWCWAGPGASTRPLQDRRTGSRTCPGRGGRSPRAAYPAELVLQLVDAIDQRPDHADRRIAQTQS